MAKKTYRTFYLKGLNLLLSDKKGERIEVVFRKGGQIDSTARFTTDNQDVQEAIEKCSGFGRDYYIEKEESDAPVVEASAPVVETKAEEEKAPLTDVKDVKRFHNIVEMRAAMAELGFEGVPEMGYLQLKSAASKEGYDFQIQKN